MPPEWLVVCHTIRLRDQAVREIIAKQIMSLTQPTNFLVVDGNEGNAQTLNAMIAQLPSRSETYFVTIDDDMVPSPGWQEAIAQAHRDIPDLGLVGLDLSNSLWGQSYMIKVPEITECGGTRIRFTEGVNIGGCFIASTRELAIDIGAIPIIPGTKYHVYHWRGPVADRLYLPTADGGRAVSDAVRETDFIMETAYALRRGRWIPPKSGARFHFSLPGSLQGFHFNENLTTENVPHPSEPSQRVLALRFELGDGQSASTMTPTFIPPEAINMPGYGLMASPTLYPGQIVRARVSADGSNERSVQAGILIQRYGENDILETRHGVKDVLSPGEGVTLEWQIPDQAGAPIALVGITISAETPAEGMLYLEWLTWERGGHGVGVARGAVLRRRARGGRHEATIRRDVMKRVL